MAKELTAQKKHPLIVMIDELDRCRPSYAVELLEVAKQLFSVDHVVFVLAVNRSELAHSIKALYGGGFDAVGYLRRFFDVDFRLPEPDRVVFIDTMLNTTQINDFFGRTQDRIAQQEPEIVRELLQGFFCAPDLSLRRIEQAIHRLGLIFASLRSNQRSFAITAVVALILRTLDADLYHRFRSGEVSDLEVVNKMFAPSGAVTLTEEDARCYFEETIILAASEVSGGRGEINSRLLQRYQELVDAEEPDAASHNPDRSRAQKIIAWANDYRQIPPQTSSVGSIGFRETVQRIELLSSGLMGEPSESGLA